MPIFEYLCEDCGNKFEKLVPARIGKWCALPILRPGAPQAAVLDLRRPRQRRFARADRDAFLPFWYVPDAGSLRPKLTAGRPF
jgi:hypothetical protein